MDRQIVCFRIPNFEIALTRLVDPSLRRRPVAVGSPHVPRAAVREISEEAAHDGVDQGMTVDQALATCPALSIIPSSPARLRRGHQDVQDIIRRFAPVWEPIAPGHLYLDLTGTHRLFGRATDAARRIEREIEARQGLAGAAGVGTSRLVSHIAVRLAPPLELRDVRPGSERGFLAPLPPGILPDVHGPAWRTVLDTLEDLNLTTLGAVAAMGLPRLELVLGSRAAPLYRWSLGIDPTPVLPIPDRPRLARFTILEPDEVDQSRLLAVLYGLSEQICVRLRGWGRVTRRLRLTVAYTDHVEKMAHQPLGHPTCWEADLRQSIRLLLARCARRRVRVRMLALEAEGLEAADRQIDLFTDGPADLPKERRLAVVIDRVRERFGADAILWGRAL